jgi:predicted heme/steroid binding protein
MRRLTLDELRRHDGLNGRPALVAYQGIVYDVSGSFHWRGGRHQVLHSAGQHFTDEMRDAPHGPDLLARCPVVGRLVSE